jgi:hypothetical protein
MKMQMREDIKKARRTAKEIASLAATLNICVTQEDADFLYNSQVKAYLRGYKDALTNVEIEAKDE